MAFKKGFKKNFKRGLRGAKKAGQWGLNNAHKADKALALAMKVARLVNVENKYHEVNFSASPTSAGAIAYLSDIPVGTTDYEREGISIKPLRLSGRLHLLMNVTAVSTALRIIIFRGKNERGIDYGVFGNQPTDLLDNDTNPYLARKNRANRFDTKFLFDKIYNFSGNGTNNKMVNFNIRLDGHIGFLENGSVVDHSVDNSGIYIAMISDQGVNYPAVRGQLTLTYVDN